jgi:hypothetical protein
MVPLLVALLALGAAAPGVRVDAAREYPAAWHHHGSPGDAAKHHHHHVVHPPSFSTNPTNPPTTSKSPSLTTAGLGLGKLLSRGGSGSGGSTRSSGAECTLDPPPEKAAAEGVEPGTSSSSDSDVKSLYFCPGVGAGYEAPEGGTKRCARSAPSRCTPGCEAHGTCNQELKRCDCPRGRSGAACDVGPLYVQVQSSCSP